MTAAPGQALENALVANPDDLGAHAAYADWLIEQGDLRGEFIQVQLALEDEKKPAEERKKLREREKELLAKHQREWLGELAPFLIDPASVTPEFTPEPGRFAFTRGWLSMLNIPRIYVNLARALARAPEARLLRQLTIETIAYFDQQEQYSEEAFAAGDDVPDAEDGSPGPFPLLLANNLGNVRVFQLGESMDDQELYPSCHTSGATAAGLVAKMPRIEELYLLAHAVDTDTLFSMASLANLRILQVCHCHDYPLEKLASNPALGRLTTLKLHPHGLDDQEAYIQPRHLEALIRSPHLKSLTHLHLHCSDVGDAGCRAIVASGILKRLKILDLRHGSVTDEGAGILAACSDLKNLEQLDLDRNALTPKGQQILKQTGVPMRIDSQMSAEEIENRMYLFEADPE